LAASLVIHKIFHRAKGWERMKGIECRLPLELRGLAGFGNGLSHRLKGAELLLETGGHLLGEGGLCVGFAEVAVDEGHPIYVHLVEGVEAADAAESVVGAGVERGRGDLLPAGIKRELIDSPFAEIVVHVGPGSVGFDFCFILCSSSGKVTQFGYLWKEDQFA